jgi:hypothetical protein
MRKNCEMLKRRVFDLEARRKPKAFAADAVSLWRLNQSTPVINNLARLQKADEARYASP